MASFGTTFQIVKLSGGYCIENTGNSKGYVSKTTVLAEVASTWYSENTNEVSAITVGASKTFAIEVSLDGGANYFIVAYGVTTAKDNGAVTDYYGFEKRGHDSDSTHAEDMIDLFLSKLGDVLDGVQDEETVYARLDVK